MKTKIEPRLIDINYLDKELNRLFNSVFWGQADELFIKHKSRFLQEQREKAKLDLMQTTKKAMSIGKKLEILCTYGDHKIVKIDRKV